MTKIVAEKIENVGSIFLVVIFITQPHTPSIAIITGPSMGNGNHTEKIENVGWFFRRNFRRPTTHTLPRPIAIITESSMGLENRPQEVENIGLTFSARFLSPNYTRTPPPHCNHRRTLDGWRKSRWKNQKRRLIFSARFLSPNHPYATPLITITQDPRIQDIESSNIFGNLPMAISNSRVPRLRWEGGENCGRKNRKRLQDVEKTFKVWTRQVAGASRQTSSRSA